MTDDERLLDEPVGATFFWVVAVIRIGTDPALMAAALDKAWDRLVALAPGRPPDYRATCQCENCGGIVSLGWLAEDFAAAKAFRDRLSRAEGVSVTIRET